MLSVYPDRYREELHQPFVKKRLPEDYQMTFKPSFIAVFALFFLASCADMQNRPKETFGTVIGAGLGALAGSQIGSGKGQMAAIAIGTLAGAWAGNNVGKSLDRADKLYAQKTSQNALEYNKIGETGTWRNPDSGRSGTTTPTRTYQTASGQSCREFQTTVTIDGKQQKAYGTACREPDGTWKITR